MSLDTTLDVALSFVCDLRESRFAIFPISAASTEGVKSGDILIRLNASGIPTEAITVPCVTN
jgi:hypothetical protein